MNTEYKAEWKSVLEVSYNVAIRCFSSEEKMFALQLMSNITGLSINDTVLSATMTNTESVREFPLVGVNSFQVGGFCREDKFSTVYTLSQFKAALKHSPTKSNLICGVEKVVLNNSYTAEVSKSGIKVGCQTFPLDTAAKLVTAIDKILGTTEKKTVPEKVVKSKSKKTYHADNLPVITFVYGMRSNPTRTVKVIEANDTYVMGLEVLSNGPLCERHHYKKFSINKMYYTNLVSFNPNAHRSIDKD